MPLSMPCCFAMLEVASSRSARVFVFLRFVLFLGFFFLKTLARRASPVCQAAEKSRPEVFSELHTVSLGRRPKKPLGGRYKKSCPAFGVIFRNPRGTLFVWDPEFVELVGESIKAP